jgi:hypothetical protein
MHLARKYTQALVLSDDVVKVVTVSALLHDIAHGPYSHSWDTVVYIHLYPGVHKGHDKHRHRVANKLMSDILTNIGAPPKELSKVWNNENKLLSAILQGPLGVDRLDFVKRDVYFTATQHFGYVEIDRIINHASIHIKHDGTPVLAYEAKIVPDAVQGLTTRLYMYNKVYLHKTVIAASILIEVALGSASLKLELVKKTKNLQTFTYLNDSILDQIIQSSDPDLAEAKYFAMRLYHRELPKMISEKRIYISPETEKEHIPGISIDRDKGEITWLGRVLSNDFSREFTKHDIHIVTEDDIVPFGKYWEKTYPHYYVETYYTKRIYKL